MQMLEKLPSVIGRTLDCARAGMNKTVFFDNRFEKVPEGITVSSPAFSDGGVIPERFTEDGQRLSPALAWRGAPNGAKATVLIVEDADSPTPHPLVHAIAWHLGGNDRSLSEGSLKSSGSRGEIAELGKNSFLHSEYLPPDPPPGHGPHRYVFQIYALDVELMLDDRPGRGAVLEAMEGHVLSKGCMIGTYERV
jgi:Raf kinase inhibitor-like YbhB/YbcL family protein